MTTPDTDGRLPLPSFVNWPIFPFEGEFRVKKVQPPTERDRVRSGEPGGRPCGSCAAPDEEYIWVDDNWRVRAGAATGVPVQVFLESRDHVDLDGLDDDRASEFGRLVVRIDRAIQAVGGIGRTHVNRWGDGAAHFHVWFYGRPLGAWQLLGFFLPLWAMTLPPTPNEVWQRNLSTVARELARVNGRAMMGSGDEPHQSLAISPDP